MGNKWSPYNKLGCDIKRKNSASVILNHTDGKFGGFIVGVTVLMNSLCRKMRINPQSHVGKSPNAQPFDRR